MYEWRAKVRMILCACRAWSESTHFANVRRRFFAWRGPNDVLSVFQNIHMIQREEHFHCPIIKHMVHLIHKSYDNINIVFSITSYPYSCPVRHARRIFICHIYPNNSDRQEWANSVDLDQMRRQIKLCTFYCLAINFRHIQLQSNLNGSNTFGTMENCSSHG